MPDTIVAIARGGMILSHALCMNLSVRNLQSIRCESYNDSKKQSALTIYDTCDLKDSNRILIVDDIADSGQTLHSLLPFFTQKYPNKEIFHADAEKLPFENNSIDTIISFHFFMHLDKEKTKKIMEECSRVLKPGGRLIFDIPSARRRKLIAYNKDGWHGNLSLSKADITKLHPDFVVKRCFGLLFLPIHRIPKKIRMGFIGVDFLFANSFLKKYSSYHIYEMIKK
jgi:hypoxanthine phosphoribosyltransferase